MIAKKANISKSSLSPILRDSVQKKRSIIKPKKNGRPKKLTDRDRRKLIRTINTTRNEDPNFTVHCELFCIPARSPDLNPIENMFHIAKKELEQQVIDSQIVRETWQEFKSRVKKTT